MIPVKPSFIQAIALLLVQGALLAAISGCGRQEAGTTRTVATAKKVPTALALSYLQPRAVGAAITRPPWIAHLTVEALDRDGLLDIVFCGAKENQVIWHRPRSPVMLRETVHAANLRSPVREV